MQPDEARRKLTTILAADVAGYTRLMREDEEATYAALAAARQIVADEIARRGGRIFNTAGDSVLAEFASAVEAVRAALAFQSRLTARDADAPQTPRLRFRVGVTVGDVMISGDDLFGDGVNLAARIEGLAEPGGICLSASVVEQVRHKLRLSFERMPPQRVKNIDEPIEVYRVAAAGAGVGAGARPAAPFAPVPRPARRRALGAGAVVIVLALAALAWLRPWAPDFAPAAVEQMALPLPDKPSIAVLPLKNLSADPEQTYFADGLTEDVVTRLAGFPNLFVIARDSTLRYRDADADFRTVAEDLGVRYVMEGSVRRAGETLRVSARLVDALAGAVLWGETYDRDLRDVFAVQDEITREVVSRIASNLVDAEFDRVSRAGTRNFAAYDQFLRGYRETEVITPASSARAVALFEQALAEDPGYARAMAALGLMRATRARFHWGDGPEDTLEAGLALTGRAAALAPDDEYPRRANAAALRFATRYEEAVAEYEAALARSPSNPDVLIALAFTYAILDRGARAVETAEMAMRLNPHPPVWYHSWRGIALFTEGRFEDAAASFRAFNEANPKLYLSHMWLAATLAHLGEIEAARAEAVELRRLAPWFTINGYLQQQKPRGGHRDKLVEGLRLAGVPEG